MSIGHMGTSLTVISRWDEALALIENIDVDASTRAAADRAMRVWILVQRGDIAVPARNSTSSPAGSMTRSFRCSPPG